MAETRCAKKQKKNNIGGVDGDGGGMIDGQLLPPTSDELMQMMNAMKNEVKDMKSKMNSMEEKLKGLQEENVGLKRRLCDAEKEAENRKNKAQLDTREQMRGIREEFKKRVNGIKRDVSDIKSHLTYHRNLLINKNWVSPVPQVPSSYWTSNGYPVAAAEVMMLFVRSIRAETRYIRVDGAPDGQIELKVPGANAIIPHDDAMLPHWEEFAEVLDDYSHFINPFREWKHTSDIVATTFEINGIKLQRQVLDILQESLSFCYFRKVSLCFNGGGDDIVCFTRKMLDDNDYLETLCLTGNPIRNASKFSDLLDAISWCSTEKLKRVGLSHSCRELDYKAICPIFDCCLREIDMSHNNITTMGNLSLETSIKEDWSLEGLHLNDNNFNDDDATSIARALQGNETLAKLDLRNNNLTDIGKGELLKAVFSSSSLNAASDCNHSCNILCGSKFTANFNNSSNKTHNRRQKLYYFLSTRNKESSVVVQMGNGITVKDMPNLLSAVQIYSEFDDSEFGLDVVPPLSILYEVLRGWNMPVLFEKAHLGSGA